MSTCKSTPPEIDDPSCRYLEDDIARGLRASLTAVLATALAGEWANYDFLKGVLSLASSQAALYGIPWTELIANLSKTPELEGLIQELQEGCQRHLAPSIEQNVPC
jgi:hypothetical protein